jgi:hypothetical protein
LAKISWLRERLNVLDALWHREIDLEGKETTKIADRMKLELKVRSVGAEHVRDRD